MSLLARPHFDALAKDYAGADGGLDPLYSAARPFLDRELDGKDVLDVGSAGVFPFDRRRAASVVSLDISPEMLARLPPDVRGVAADARRMPLPDASFDAVLFSHSLHHVVGADPPDCEAQQERAVAEAFRVLRPGGSLVLFEPVVSPALFELERALFRPLAALLALRGVPPVYLRTRASWRRLADFEAVPLEPTGWVDPLSGTFPGLVRMPVGLFPTRFELFFARKPRG